MPHNFFRKRACIEARDHGEPSRAVKSAGAAKRNKWMGTTRAKRKTGEEAVYAGFASLLTERRAVVSSRGASVRLWGRVDSPRQDRKALRKPGFPFQEGRLRRFGLKPRKLRFRLCGMGFPIDCLNPTDQIAKKMRRNDYSRFPFFVEDIERRPGGWDNFAKAKKNYERIYPQR
jgi:hypothetical protein